MSKAIPPLPQYAFMAWCSVKKIKKAQGQHGESMEVCFVMIRKATFTRLVPTQSNS
jgi:hypothetical protein